MSGFHHSDTSVKLFHWSPGGQLRHLQKLPQEVVKPDHVSIMKNSKLKINLPQTLRSPSYPKNKFEINLFLMSTCHFIKVKTICAWTLKYNFSSNGILHITLLFLVLSSQYPNWSKFKEEWQIHVQMGNVGVTNDHSLWSHKHEKCQQVAQMKWHTNGTMYDENLGQFLFWITKSFFLRWNVSWNRGSIVYIS